MRIQPAAPGPLSVRQAGTDIVLSADINPTRTDGTPLPAGSQVQVLRMPASQGFRPGLVSERYLVQQFLRQASAIGVFDPRTPAGGAGGRFTYRDRAVAPETAEDAEGAAPQALLYAVRIAEPGGRTSSLRPPILVETAPPPALPGALEGEVTEGAVRLRWEASPAPGAAYNVYRRETAATAEPETPLNAVPITVTEFVDRTFRYDVEYQYFVRAALAHRTTPVESPAGPGFTVRPHDRFAPATPTGIAVVVEGGQIRVYWFPNAEPDLAGYRIYRRAEGEAEARPIGEAGPSESAFVDAGASPGVRYHYSVGAFDGATPVNESPRSQERSERLAPVAGGPETGATPHDPGGVRR